MTRIIGWIKSKLAQRAKRRTEKESYEEANSVMWRP